MVGGASYGIPIVRVANLLVGEAFYGIPIERVPMYWLVEREAVFFGGAFYGISIERVANVLFGGAFYGIPIGRMFNILSRARFGHSGTKRKHRSFPGAVLVNLAREEKYILSRRRFGHSGTRGRIFRFRSTEVNA